MSLTCENVFKMEKQSKQLFLFVNVFVAIKIIVVERLSQNAASFNFEVMFDS